MTVFEGADRAPMPRALTARTWKVYAVPLVSPVTRMPIFAAGMPITVGTSVPAVFTTTS